jgi:hypothetical protein
MEQLTINIPDEKSALVKQVLIALGSIIQPESSVPVSDFKKRLASISVSSEDDLKIFEESRQAFQSLKPAP